jgi:hypothetical protein
LLLLLLEIIQHRLDQKRQSTSLFPSHSPVDDISMKSSRSSLL